MKVALIKNAPGLGKVGDIRNVSDGYARNFLLKNKLAEILTPAVERALRLEKERQEKYSLELKEKTNNYLREEKKNFGTR